MKSLLKLDLRDLSDTNIQLETVIDTLEIMYQELNHIKENLDKSSGGQYVEKITNELIPTIERDIDYLSQTLEMNFEHLLTIDYGVNDIYGPKDAVEIDYEALSKWVNELEILTSDIQKTNNNLVLNHVREEYVKMRNQLEAEIQKDKRNLDYIKVKHNSDLLLDLEYNYHMYTEVVEDFMRVNLSNQLTDIKTHVRKIYKLYQFDQEYKMNDLLNRQSHINLFNIGQFGEEYMEYKISHEIKQSVVIPGIKLNELKPIINPSRHIIHPYNENLVKLSEVKTIKVSQ